MRANYLLGRAYYDMGETPLALKYYHEAADCADTTQIDCDYKLLSRVHGQMGQIFLKQESPKDAIDEFCLSAKYSYVCNDTLMYISNLDFMGSAYEQMNELDSALEVTRKTVTLFEKYGFHERACLSGASVIDILTRRGYYKEAKSLLNQCFSLPGFLDDKKDVVKGKEIFSYSAGYYYLSTGNNDSAMYWFRKLEKQACNANHLACAYEGLARAYHNMGRPDSSAIYALKAYNHNDSSHQLKATEGYQRSHALYNYTRNQQLAQTKTLEASRSRQQLYFLTLLMVVFILGFMFLFYHLRNRHKMKQLWLIAKNKELSDTMTRLDQEYTEQTHLVEFLKNQVSIKEQTIATLSFQEEQVQQLIDEKACRIAELEDKVLELENALGGHNRSSVDGRINRSVPVRKIHDYLRNNGSSLPASYWSELQAMIDKEIPALAEVILSSGREFRKEEIQLIYLTRSLFSGNEIARLLDISPQHVSTLKKRFLSYIFHVDVGGAPEFTRRLKAIK